ncbi:XRE family transcriptional regulator [Micromonospora sp. NPDC050686]|uniref:XRE family transcriptional regulator n=1 Tax=Micromonospora sp. NPDC050686 TaxID=3154631 RepID=UPI00340B1738
MATPLAGERIRSVRHLLGVSQVDLSKAANISQSLVSQIENGTKEATDEVLESIASATGMPRSFFEVAPPDVPLGTLRFRKLSSAKQGDTKRVKALFDEAYRIVFDLAIETGLPLPDLPIAQGEIGHDDIEKLAAETREALQLGGDGPIRHLTRACERAGVVVVPLTLPGEHNAEEEAIGHFGVSFWPGKSDPALVGYFSSGSGDRLRYTLAHEVGHLVLHTRRRNVADAEGEANRFAGALLMPKSRAQDVLSSGITLRDLALQKSKWGISIQALIMRGAHLGLIDEQRKTSLFKQLSARGWRKNEPVRVVPEEPALFARLLTVRFGEPLRMNQVSDRLGLGPVILRSLAPTPQRVSTPKNVIPLR